MNIFYIIDGIFSLSNEIYQVWLNEKIIVKVENYEFLKDITKLIKSKKDTDMSYSYDYMIHTFYRFGYVYISFTKNNKDVQMEYGTILFCGYRIHEDKFMSMFYRYINGCKCINIIKEIDG